MTALKDLLANPEQKIALVVEFDSRNPSTNVVTTNRVASLSWNGTEGYPRRLLSVGDLIDRVEVDTLSSLTQNTFDKAIIISNVPVHSGENGPYDHLRVPILHSVSDRTIRVLGGHPTEPIANYETLYKSSCRGEILFNDDNHTIELLVKSALEILTQDLKIKTYVGEPGMLRNIVVLGGTSARASTSYNVAHDLTSFTIGARYQFTDDTTPEVAIEKSTGSLNYQIIKLSSKRIWFRWTEGGVLKTLGPGPFVTGQLQEIIVGFFRNRHAYLIVDGVVHAETTVVGSPDLVATGIKVLGRAGTNSAGLDWRILDHYLAIDEARSWFSIRASDDDSGLVLLLRGDDRIGNTLTDYSSIGSDATITGVEDTDFSWDTSGLGTEDLSGKSMMCTIGNVYNAKADLVDPILEVFRYNDIPSAWPIDALRDQGEELGGLDYTVDDPLIYLVAEAGEPITFDTLNISGFAAMPDSILGEILITRGPLTEYNALRYTAMYPARMGLNTRVRSVQSVFEEVMSSGLGYATRKRDGKLYCDVLLPPISPSPRDGSCLEIVSPGGTGNLRSGVRWTGTNTPSGQNVTYACWFKTNHLGPGNTAGGRVNIIDTAWNGVNYVGHQLSIDFEFGIPSLKFEAYTGLSAPDQVRTMEFGDVFNKLGEWIFIGVTNDEGLGLCTFYVNNIAGTGVVAIGTTPSLGLGFALGSTVFNIGGYPDGGKDHFFYGSVFEPQMHDTALSSAQLTAVMNTTPVAGGNLLFMSPLDGSSTLSVTDISSSSVGTIIGDVRQVPDLEINFDTPEDPAPIYREKHLVPASRIHVEYNRNWSPMQDSDIVATVSKDERGDLKRDGGLQVKWVNPDLKDDYLAATDVRIAALWSDLEGAQTALRIARYRLGAGRKVIEIENAGRRSLLLDVGNEIRLRGSLPVFSGGPVYKVVSRRSKLNDTNADLVGFGG